MIIPRQNIISVIQLHPAFHHILCFTEHHMNYLELQQTCADCYNLGACYSRTFFEKGAVCTYVCKSLMFCKQSVEK